MTATLNTPTLNKTDLDKIRKAKTLMDLGLSQPGSGQVPQLFRRRDAETAADAQEFSANGWDTVFAIRMPDLNKAIVEKDAYPHDFQLDVDAAAHYAIHGTFGPWQMTRGGSGEIVFFEMAIPTGEMTFGSSTYQLNGATCYVSIKLHYLPTSATPAEAASAATKGGTATKGGAAAKGGTRWREVRPGHSGVETPEPDIEIDNLMVNDTPRGPADPVAVIQNLVLPEQPAPYVYALMKGALEAWFNANLGQFTHIFATVDLNKRASREDFQWLSPTYTGYAYHNGSDDASSLFGVLSMTEDRPPDMVDYGLGAGAIPEGQRSGLSISMERFLSKIMLPGLPKIFIDTTVSSFRLNSTNTVIENTTPIRMPDVKVGLINYTPWVQRLTLQVVGDEIQLDTLTQINISPGIRAMVQTSTYQRIILVNKPDGSQTLDFQQTRDPYSNNWIDKDTWVLITEIIVSIAGAVAGGVAGRIVKDTTRAIIAVILILVVAGIAAATPELIAAVAGGNAAKALPAIDLLTLNATAPVAWPTASGFTLTSAGLNGCFQLGGDPNFI